MHRTTKLCALGMIVLALGGCEDVPVGFMDIELADGTVTRVHIDRTSASRYLPPIGLPQTPMPIEVLLEGWDEKQRSYAMVVELEPPYTWSSGDVRYCTPPFGHGEQCARSPIDVAGDGYADLLVQREADDDGERVRAWGRFADDGQGPRAARTTFHFDPSTVVLIQQEEADAP